MVLPDDVAELVRYPDDEIWLRAAGHGDIQVADYSSTEREGPPMHRHPWDEAQIVVSGYAEFRIGEGETPWRLARLTARTQHGATRQISDV